MCWGVGGGREDVRRGMRGGVGSVLGCGRGKGRSRER